MKLSIIIVNYNVKYFLELCLSAVIKGCLNIKAEIFVVDNNSNDGSRDYLTGKFPGVHFKWNATNDGFAKANNSVLKEVQGEYILFLNPDTIIAEDCFELCISFADNQKDFGALGIRMIDGSGNFLKESKRLFPSASATLFKLAGITALFPRSRLFAAYYAGHLNDHEDHEIDVIAGAFMMVSKKAIEKTGGFDEDFFMYGEDVDLSFRVQQAGFKNFYFAGSTIIHFKGESAPRSASYIKHFYGAMDLFVKKHATQNVNFLRVGIASARTLAKVTLLLKTKSKVRNRQSTRTLAIVAVQKCFNEVLQIVKFFKQPFIITGRIAINDKDREASIGTLMDLEKMKIKKMFDHLLLTEDPLSFKETIAIVQKHKGKFIFMFHAKGSSSIVGSNNKNETGFFISK